MAVPIIYNLRSVKARWTSAIVAVLGIAGTVGVFVAMLSLARGFKATLVSSGSPGNAIVLRAGATSEMAGVGTLDSVNVLHGSPAVLQEFKDAVTSDPRMNVDVTREVDYYDKQSQSLTKLITILGGLVAGIMGVGAIFGALNTMY